MTATQKQVDELRSLFQQKLDAGISSLPSGPHPIDLERTKDDNWLRKFISHSDSDIPGAVTAMIDCMTWRKQFGVNEINESNINMDFINEGLFYPRGKDIDNCPMLIFNSKKHVKGQRDSEEIKRCVVYWFERMDKVEKCDKISIFFDMADAGLSNMDMDFTKYLISLFKFYYPDFLNYIMIYEMPWVLSAAFKVIKTLLPAKAVAKMKFVTKSTVTDFVPLEHAQVSWGGKDDYVFTFIPEPAVGNVQLAQVVEKKVTFSDPGSPMQEKQLISGDSVKKMISLSPSECVTFANDGKEIHGSFKLTNCHTGPISYKIKTTSPEKFRVRPSIGILLPQATQVIGLLLLEGYQNTAAGREKFLVTCVSIDKENMSPKDLTDMWKDASKLNVEQHKLRCAYPPKRTNGTAFSLTTENGHSVGHADLDSDAKDIDEITKLVASLKHNQESLDKNLKALKTIQLFNLLLTAILLCLIIYFFGSLQSNSTASNTSGEFCTAP